MLVLGSVTHFDTLQKSAIKTWLVSQFENPYQNQAKKLMSYKRRESYPS